MRGQVLLPHMTIANATLASGLAATSEQYSVGVAPIVTPSGSKASRTAIPRSYFSSSLTRDAKSWLLFGFSM